MKKTIKSLVLTTIVFCVLFVFAACDYECEKCRDESSILCRFTCRYECNTCRDKTTVKCGDCLGKKQRACSACGGDALLPCALCNGVGSRTCFSCGGAGMVFEYNFITNSYTYRGCYVCAGGRVTCPLTAPCGCGNGRITCITCTGQGAVDCPDCAPQA